VSTGDDVVRDRFRRVGVPGRFRTGVAGPAVCLRTPVGGVTRLCSVGPVSRLIGVGIVTSLDDGDVIVGETVEQRALREVDL
jgi:hypothetical protein